MRNVRKISVQVTMRREDHDSDLHLVAEAFDEALDLLGFGYEDVVDKFFTMRFDETDNDSLAVTVSAAEKKEN